MENIKLRDEIHSLKRNHRFRKGQTKSKLNEIKETFILWCEKSDVNGISKIFEYKNLFIRLFFLFVLLASLGITAWIMSWSIFAYFEYGIVSQIGVVYEQPTEFPAVTICDNDLFTTQTGQDLINELSNSSDCQNSENLNSIYCAKQLASILASDPSYGDENRKLLGLNLDQISCSYNGGMNCDLHWHWQYDFGNCFQFNVGLDGTNNYIDKKMAQKAGIDFGLQITVYSFTNRLILKYGNYNYLGTGMKVFIHNRTMEPRWSEDGVYAKPGENTMIGVKRIFVSNFPSPYTQCTDLTSYSSVIYDYFVKSNITYSQKDCFDICFELQTIRKCGCYLNQNLEQSLNIYNNRTSQCLDMLDVDCFSKEYSQVDPVKCASEYCPLECHSIQYDLSVSSLISPTFEEYNSLNLSSTISYDEWRTQIININVYYSQLEYTLIKETPAMNLANLIANLGGTMSLIVSLSFFTLVEIGELFSLIFYVLIRSKDFD